MKNENALSHTSIDYILRTLKVVGDKFLAEFRKQSIPQDLKAFKTAFDSIDESCTGFLKSQLLKEFPDIQWADGEMNLEQQRTPLAHHQYWICDSMDGAVQYLQHLAGWTINLVLVTDGNPTFAAIYNPLEGEMYHAIKGKGAFLNGKVIAPSTKTEKWMMLAAFNHPPFSAKISGLNSRIGKSVIELLDEYGAVRNYGPTGLQIAYVGSGRIDVFAQQGLDTYNWLAGILIAREAGAKILNANGSGWKWGDDSLVACNSAAEFSFKR